tara:strand:+ start:2272 stop:3552 length:1281 start_codon:yes stop_codon:yes gene_type:complete
MSLLFQKKIITNLFLLFFSFIVSFLFVEFFLSGFLSYKKTNSDILNQKIFDEYIKKNDISFDARTRLEIYQSLKDKGDYFPSLSPSIKLNNLISLSNISNSNIIHCNETGIYDIWKSDRFGFRNDNIFWDQENLDIVLLGDSFAAGACVENHQNIAGNLIKNHNYKVVNLAMSGSGPLDQLAIFREYTKNLNSKFFVLVFYEGNDFKSLNIKQAQNEILFRYLNNQNFSQNLIRKQNLLDKELKTHISIIEKDKKNSNLLNYKGNKNLFDHFSFKGVFKFNTIRTILSEIFIDKFPYMTENRLFTNNKYKKDLFIKVIKILNNEVQKKNSKLIVVYMPAMERYGEKYNKSSKLRLNKLNYIYDTVIGILKKENVSYVDLRNNLFEKNNFIDNKLFPLNLAGFGHLSSNGYLAVSNSINEYLNQISK